MKELLIGAHLLGLSLSFVNALSIDTRIARHILFGTKLHSDRGELQLLALRSGFFLLLASGLGLLFWYWVNAPGLLSNPKLWAKTTIVVIAGLNGCLIERFLRVNKSSRIAAHGTTTILLLSISWGSWVTAFVLGVWKSINFVASFSGLLTEYFLLVSGLSLMLSLATRKTRKNLNPRPAIQSEKSAVQSHSMV